VCLIVNNKNIKLKFFKRSAAPLGGEQGGALCGEHKGPEGRLACIYNKIWYNNNVEYD